MKKPKQSKIMTELQRLMDIMKSMPKTYDGANVYIHLHYDWGMKKISIKSKDFRYIMTKKYTDIYEESPSDRALSQLIAYELGVALERQSENLQYRINHKEGVIYYDLCKAEGCVKISADGWEIVPEGEGLFKQYSTQKAQVIPKSGKRGLDVLKDFINLPNCDWPLFIVYLVSCFFPNIQHPMPLQWYLQSSAPEYPTGRTG